MNTIEGGATAIPVWQSEVWAPPVSHHAESPLWDHRSGRLLWVDQHRGLVRSAAVVDREVQLFEPIDVGSLVGAVALSEGGGWVAAAADGFIALSEDGRVTSLAAVIPDDGIGRRMNDGKVDPAGRFWAGTIALDHRPGVAALSVLERGRTRTAIPGVSISNGLAWSPSGETMFFIDSPTQRVDRYRVDGSKIERDGASVIIDKAAGTPDGMCIDDEGMLWVALWGGSAVHRYTPEGELIGRVEVDAPLVSSCTFGGADRDTLFITTSTEGYGPEELARHPKAGAVFAASPGVTGPAAAMYRP